MALPAALVAAQVAASAAKIGISLLSSGDGLKNVKTLTDVLSKLTGLSALKKFLGKGASNILAWETAAVGSSVLWAVPKRDHPNPTFRNLKDIEIVVVMTGELAVYIAPGILQPLPPGVWKLEKSARNRSNAKIVFVNTTTFPIKWGIPQESGPLSKDGLKIGLSGEARVRIIDPIKFVHEVQKNKDVVTLEDIKEWIYSDIVSILRDRVSKMNATDITSDSLQVALQAKGEQELPKYGLKIEKLNVMYVALPQSYIMAREQHTVTKIYGQTELEQAQVEAQKRKVIGETELELEAKKAQLKTGTVSEIVDKAAKVGAAVKVHGDSIEVTPTTPSTAVQTKEEKPKESILGAIFGKREKKEEEEGPQFCPFCGKQLPTRGLKFCPFCGKKLPF